jgi:hypothetical protein
MYENTIPHIEKDMGAMPFRNKQPNGQRFMTGLQFNNRNSTKFAKAPFFKIYSKTLDLRENSNLFASSYLESIPKDLYRLEFTLKNKRHLATFDIGNTFKDLLSLSQEQIEEMYQRTLRAVLNERTIEIEAPKEGTATPNELFVLGCIMLPLKMGMQWGVIRTSILSTLKGANKYKKGQLLDKVFEEQISTSKEGKKYIEFDKALNEIGYTF